MKSIEEVLNKKISGLYYDNRLILPFKAYFFKVIIDKEIITDFSPSSKGINIEEEDDFTSLYFLEHKQLRDIVTHYESIKLVVVEKDKDIFDFANHKKLAVYLGEKHEARIEETDADILFIE